jgi:hypothetical protein
MNEAIGIHISSCPDKPILAGFVGSFALYQLPTLAGRHDDRDLISLTRQPVNTPHPAMTMRTESGVSSIGLTKGRDTVGQPPRTEIGMPNMPSLKAKKLRNLPREKVLLEL